ncbi:MAG: hypothetical protein E7813_06610 [Bradyrhizobium sp.]|uniref:COG4223 family protein n=1 Tax=Bradyrhizobium sp. TaxID=376 RepID=UPI0012233794|nr:hypothetical protein [Bradyrhizobium sp.]THD71059.1 MAG: hypothetical protein E7813_06610 [Bradyrhizobium sp.]
MVDDRPEDNERSPDLGRAKRAPPTIDLEASEVSGETRDPGDGAGRARWFAGPSKAAISSAIVAIIAGAATAALVIGVAWFAGWPSASPPAAPTVDNAVIDGLATRIASVESKTSTPTATASDPAAAARIEALEKSVAALRSELAAARAQSEKLAAAINDAKSAPREAAPAPDLAAINERLAQIERTTSAQTTEIAQEGARIADSRPADDAPLRRLVVTSMLDVSVRQGDPYVASLAAAKSLATDADPLKPLDGFAASGVPSAAALSRELLTLVPKLSPPAPENATTGSGVLGRLEAGASRLVRIQRTDTVGNDRGAIVARVTAAALRNDMAEARRELNTLAPDDRAAAQGWLDKADARDAALAASRQFAADAMAALAKPRP